MPEYQWRRSVLNCGARGSCPSFCAYVTGEAASTMQTMATKDRICFIMDPLNDDGARPVVSLPAQRNCIPPMPLILRKLTLRKVPVSHAPPGSVAATGGWAVGP